MHQPFGLSCRARRVENEQWIFGCHPLGGACDALLGCGLVHPNVAPQLHIRFGIRALDDQHLLDDCQALDGGVRDSLERNALRAAQPLVCRDDDLGLRVDDSVAKRIGAETSKDDRMDRTDAGAGQHRVGELRNHREIDTNSVAFANAQGSQGVRNAPHLGLELSERDVLVLPRLVRHEDDGGLVGVARCVSVHAVHRDIESSAAKPDELARSMFFEHAVRLVEPVQLLALGFPVVEIVGQTVVIEGLVVLHAADVSSSIESRL